MFLFVFFFPPLADLAETKEFRERGSYTRKSHWSIQGNKTDRNIERHTERYTYIESHRVKKKQNKTGVGDHPTFIHLNRQRNPAKSHMIPRPADSQIHEPAAMSNLSYVSQQKAP